MFSANMARQQTSRCSTDKFPNISGQTMTGLSQSWMITIPTGKILFAILLLVNVAPPATVVASPKQLSIRLPDIRPDHAEQYLCISHRVPPSAEGEFIVGFNPQGDASRVHHMLLYGCSMPGIYQRDSPHFVWDCSGMHSSSSNRRDVSFEEQSVCQGRQQILYGWALNAPALKLPKSVGFKIGGPDSDINFLVLQVHFGHYHAFLKNPDLTDNSGLILDIEPNKGRAHGITKRAGVLLLISLGHVLQGTSKHEIWCDIDEDITIHPIRYRVHTHKLGTKVMGAKIGKEQINSLGFKIQGEDQIIGVGDPQQPQMFYPVSDHNITLTRGDTVYGSCEFNNNKSHIVNIGQTGDDEMCNFYLMYWTDSPKLLTKDECFGKNPPSLLSYYANLL